MKIPKLLSRKLIQIGLVLFAMALVSIGFTLWITWQLEGGSAAVNVAGRLRLQMQQLSGSSQPALPERKIQSYVLELDKNISLLKIGDPARPIFVPWSDSIKLQFSEIENSWQSSRLFFLNPNALPLGFSPPPPEKFIGLVDRFALSIEHELSSLTAVLNLFQFAMMALAIGAAVVMLFTGYFYVLNPLAELHQGLQKLERGDFSARVQIDHHDEFGQAAAGFNHMAERLQLMYGSLEAQVAAKTQSIELQRQRIETLYDISAFLSRSDSVESLTKGFAERVRKVMNADAVAVRWSAESNQRYLMLASDCLPKEMLEAEYSLLANACACGNSQPDALTRVIQIHSHDDQPMRLCAKIGYQSLISVPVRLQQRMLGEIDLFFRGETTLRMEEVELLDALASHLASALESLRATALEREAAVSQERAHLARELHDSIAQSLAFLKIQVQLIRSTSQKAQPCEMSVALDELDEGLRESISDVRELLVHFRTRTNTEDIEQPLQETLQKFKHQTGLAAQFEVKGQGLPLPSDVQVQVLHVVQEALSNIRKHAKAQHVFVRVLKGEQWRFFIQDDGVGFDTAVTPSSAHVGLSIMRERAARIGAHIDLESELGEGTTLSLILPTHPAVQTATLEKFSHDFHTQTYRTVVG